MANKNIWVAAGDGDLQRVKDLKHTAINPNAPDPFTYTSMHAAASYGHIHVLEYLISKGGDVNITDSDGDTPLYTVENVETAQFLVDHGAIIDRVNSEGVSPISHLSEDFPQVSAFLESHPSHVAPDNNPQNATQNISQSQYAQNVASEQLTTNLLSSLQQLVEQGIPQDRIEDELRRLVGEAVFQGLVGGYAMSQEEGSRTAATGARREHDPGDGHGGENSNANGTSPKRPRTE
uniref:Uncharacterized protein n=1 Tax=Moniliophthora roreri TaxID=221103 RepID=A0A0W0FRM7_MONRR